MSSREKEVLKRQAALSQALKRAQSIARRPSSSASARIPLKSASKSKLSAATSSGASSVVSSIVKSSSAAAPRAASKTAEFLSRTLSKNDASGSGSKRDGGSVALRPKRRPTMKVNVNSSSQAAPPTQLQQKRAKAEKLYRENFQDNVIDTPYFMSLLLRRDLKMKKTELPPTPARFVNHRHYIAHFLPMLLRETSAEVLSKAIEEVEDSALDLQSSPVVYMNDRTKMATLGYGRGRQGRENDDKSDRDDLMKFELLEVKDTTTTKNTTTSSFANGRVSKGDGYRPNDILLIYRSNYPLRSSLIPQGGGRKCAISTSDVIMAKVESHRRSIDKMWVTVSRHAMDKFSAGNSSSQQTFRVFKASNVVTALREFQALSKLEKMSMRDEFLNVDKPEEPVTRTPIEADDQIYYNGNRPRGVAALMRSSTSDGTVANYGTGFIKYFEKKYNESQMLAIATAADFSSAKRGITLVKGPPGTGKTTTLVGLLNALHVRQVNKYHAGIASLTASMASGSLSQSQINSKWFEAARNKPRILVTAPSNGAVDNVILKIFESGFVDGTGKNYKPPIARVGRGQSKAVQAVSLDTLVDDIFKDAVDPLVMEPRIAAYKVKLKELAADIALLNKRLCAMARSCPYLMPPKWEVRCKPDFRTSGQVYFVNHHAKDTQMHPPPRQEGLLPSDGVSVDSCPEYKHYLKILISKVEHHEKTRVKIDNCTLSARSDDAETRHTIEANLLEDIQITFVTLGSAGSPSLQNSRRKFDFVVVDEAAQSVEPSTLIALQLGTQRAVLVGDPEQLPATIFDSSSGRVAKYDRSLFQRLEEGGVTVRMLDVQYRMRRSISEFPRMEFYHGLLKDSENVDGRPFGKCLRRSMEQFCPILREFTILNLRSREEKSKMSLINKGESELVVKIVQTLQKGFGFENLRNRVGVITPYSRQVSLIKQSLAARDGLVPCEVNTVDGFQGREKDIIIFSAVRAGVEGRGVGFLSDYRRVNVALTRPKEMLLIVADVARVQEDALWKRMFDRARQRGNLVDIHPRHLSDLTKVPPASPSIEETREEGKVAQGDISSPPSRPLEGSSTGGGVQRASRPWELEKKRPWEHQEETSSSMSNKKMKK